MLALIQRDDCALCDEAWEILHQAGVSDFESVFIDGNSELELQYGALVPVLRNGRRELYWPFDAEQVKTWLELFE
jgi:hypothetical protein